MKTMIRFSSNRLRHLGLLSLAACLLAVPPARAGLAVIMEMAHEIDNQYAYTNYQILVWDVITNSTPPAAPLGGYVISSPSGAVTEGFQLSAAGISGFSGSGHADFSDYHSFIQEITNGNWTITVTNATTTNVYAFVVSAPGFTSGSMPDVNILIPAQGAVNLTNAPIFTWLGLPAWGSGDIQVEINGSQSGFFEENFLSTTQTNWNSPAILPDGPNSFDVDYVSSLSSSVFIASTPTNNLSQPISGWTFQSFLDSYAISSFTVGNHAPGVPGGTPLVAHYTFDDGNVAATDTSGNGNTLTGYYSDSGGSVVITNDSKQGAYAAAFSGPFAFSGGNYYTDNTNLMAALSGSFSVSLWLKTTQVAGNNTNDGIFNGAGIVSALAYNHAFDTNYVNPMILTGSKLAFATVTGGGTVKDTLHSAASINTSNYVHVVVTRNQTTGEKRIYINGSLDASDFATTDLLNGSAFLQIGLNNGQGFNGKLDDIQFYSTPLSAAQVLQLYNNPGSTLFTNGNANLSSLVSNGGFETGDFSGWTDDGSGDVTADTNYVHSGAYGAEFGEVGSLGYIYQTLSTAPGTNYYLSFWLDSPDGLTPNEFLVSWNGTTLLDETNLPAIGWTNILFQVTATGHSTVLEFGFRDDPTELGLDDVSVTTTNPVPAAPVSVSLNLNIQREHYNGIYDAYFLYPDITAIG
ncbi:MAG: LamG-like jellyroll fold domain-containing protein, partial [Verrucomicrobiota bacterium]